MLPVGFILKNTYKIQRHIASGGFGNTYEAINIHNNMVIAIKEFFMKTINIYDDNYNVVVANKDNESVFQEQREKFIREAQTLACLNNPHIVRVFDSFNANYSSYYVMEFLKGSTLSDIVGHSDNIFEESLATNLLIQVLNALHDIHNKNIMHLDIKPANIIVDDNYEVKIIDFGASKIQSNSTESVATYTPAYAPVELQQQQFDKFGPWTDIYSAGATFYYLLTRSKPPLASDILNNGDTSFRFGYHISEKTQKLVKWMMQPAVADRPANVAQIFKFFETGNIPKKNADYNKITEGSECSTILPSNNHNIDTYRKNEKNNVQPAKDKKKNSNGCIWTILCFLILIIVALFLLWKLNIIYLPSSVSTKDYQTIEYDDSEDKESELFDKLMNICNDIQGRVSFMETEDELNGLREELINNINEVINMKIYVNVNLTDSHKLIYREKVNDVNQLITERRKLILDELARIEESQNQNDMEDEMYMEDEVLPIVVAEDSSFVEDDNADNSSDNSFVDHLDSLDEE